jgi:hypothetical protein
LLESSRDLLSAPSRVPEQYSFYGHAYVKVRGSNPGTFKKFCFFPFAKMFLQSLGPTQLSFWLGTEGCVPGDRGRKLISHLHLIPRLRMTGERLRWSRSSILAFGTQVRGFKLGRSRRIFRAKKSSARLPSGGKYSRLSHVVLYGM